ncbi:MAG: PAS domain S-box protein [Nitrospirota bacterium]
MKNLAARPRGTINYETTMFKPGLKSTIRIAFLYAIFGSLWILISDMLLAYFVADPLTITEIQTFKGWAFVSASAILLYLIVRREFRTRELAEQALRDSEEKYHNLVETANDAIFIADAGTGLIIDANKKAGELLGIPAKEIIGMHQTQLHPAEDAGYYKRIFADHIESGQKITEDLFVLRRNGERIPVDISASITQIGDRKIVQGIFRDITARKQVKEALQKERDRAQMYLNVAGVMILVISVDGNVDLINRKGCEMLGYPEKEIIGRNWFDTFIPVRLRDEVKGIFVKLMAGEIDLVGYFETPVLTKDGEERMIAWHNTLLKDENGKVSAALSSGEDITARKQAEELARHRLKRLSALHSIDMVINSSLDLQVTLNEFLEQVISQLNVDAADVLLLNPYSQMLEFAARKGFRSPAIKQPSIRIGEGIAGKAAMERNSISIPDLSEESSLCKRTNLLRQEGFVAYYAIPLIAKGQVKGVLEIFNRSPLTFDPEWLNFFEALAARAAIAIDNATLFEDLQRSNIELSIAYDATLEGWAHALDLRSKETEQHTERVTEMTLRLARAMGMSDKELMNVRRGALLHDIGKIGIPDGILLKPGPLTDEEWDIMHRHPVYAFEMLLPIAYLRPALDIPYCHHERWDGTGYPRGLKGEQIPLSARIFSVVDVWDALYSEERPYRQTLSEEKVREHIRSLSGTHLDPGVVEVFLNMEW